MPTKKAIFNIEKIENNRKLCKHEAGDLSLCCCWCLLMPSLSSNQLSHFLQKNLLSRSQPWRKK